MYSKYGSVQSARDMNLSLTVKPPTEISVSPDTVSSVKSASTSNCVLLVEARNLYLYSKMHLRIFNSIPLYFSLLPWASLTIIGGWTRVATHTVRPIEFRDRLLGNNFVFLRILYYSRPATCRWRQPCLRYNIFRSLKSGTTCKIQMLRHWNLEHRVRHLWTN